MVTEKFNHSKENYLNVYLTVTSAYQGWRIDQFLAHHYPDYSRNRWQQALKSHHVLLNGEPVKRKAILTLGDIVSGELPIAQETPDQSQDIPLNVIYQDSDIIIIDKPAGMVVHPAPGNKDGTLLNALLFHFPKVAQLPRAGIVHRLDKDTSGLMVVAHSLKAHTHLVNQLQSREMGRTYLALVYRYVTAGETIDLPIGRHPKDRVKMAVRQDGKSAITHYRIEERFNEVTLLRVKLETGRTHQIRVHLAHAHYPLVGDQVYGQQRMLPKGLNENAREALSIFPRQALHATELQLTHPSTGETCNFHSSLPADITKLITLLRQSASAS